jgi:hypothetical protein
VTDPLDAPEIIFYAIPPNNVRDIHVDVHQRIQEEQNVRQMRNLNMPAELMREFVF